MMRRRLIRLALGMLAGAAVIVGAANAVVALGGGGWTRDPAAARPAQAALVLGAQVHRDGSPSAMLEPVWVPPTQTHADALYPLGPPVSDSA